MHIMDCLQGNPSAECFFLHTNRHQWLCHNFTVPIIFFLFFSFLFHFHYPFSFLFFSFTPNTNKQTLRTSVSPGLSWLIIFDLSGLPRYVSICCISVLCLSQDCPALSLALKNVARGLELSFRARPALTVDQRF